MKKSALPFKQVLFVCTNARPAGERISCAGAGRCGDEILQKLKAYIKENRLESKARVAKSGCQEKCEVGPNAMVLPQNEFLSNLGVADVEDIIETYLAPLL
jgi:NADH:ubiquinone oxidoreductase subunit E